MDRWHLGRGGQTSGPYTWAQLVDMARAGQIAPADLLWQEGTQGWQPASTFAGRLPLPGPAALPAPPPLPVGVPPAIAAPGGPNFFQRLVFEIKRAAEWNLHNLKVSDEETRLLTERGVDDEDARKFHAWRRSVLYAAFWGGIIAATLATIITSTEKHENMTELGQTLEFLHVCTLWVIPIFAARARKAWLGHKRSRRLLGIGWTISFVTPLVLALVPVHWRYQMGEPGEARAQAEATLRLLGAIGSYLTLMPAVLALIPGIMRACLRIKILLPQSILPGWFLVGMAPFWTFLFLVVFVTINQIAGDTMLILGILAITSAPMLYLVNVSKFTQPISKAEDLDKMHKVQQQVRIILMAGLACLVIWLFTASVFGMRIVGTEEGTSMIRPWSPDLFRFPIEFATHSLFTMALASDLFMAMNLSVWLHTKAFVASPEAREYDRRMAEIDEAGGKE